MIHVIPFGTSEPQNFALRDRGAALVGTGFDVDLEIVDLVGAAVVLGEGDSLPTVAWVNQAGGTVQVTGVEVLPIGSYRVRYKLTDGDGEVGYCPNVRVQPKNEPWDVWTVARFFA